MNAPLDLLVAAQTRLILALDGRDVAEIEAATAALATAAEQLRTTIPTPGSVDGKSAIERAIRDAESARLRARYHADHSRRRLQVVLGLRGGGATLGYGRNGRVRLPAA